MICLSLSCCLTLNKGKDNVLFARGSNDELVVIPIEVRRTEEEARLDVVKTPIDLDVP